MVNLHGIHINQKILVSLCREYDWRPLFLESTENPPSRYQFERELEALKLTGHLRLHAALRQKIRASSPIKLSQYRGVLERFFFSLKLFSLFRSWRNDQANRILRRILSEYQLGPQVVRFDRHADLTQLWGLEMKYWHSLKKYHLVVALGKAAEHLNFHNKKIDKYLSLSSCLDQRSKTHIALNALKRSPQFSRSDYEKAILRAWLNDPDCMEYVRLLREVVVLDVSKNRPLRSEDNGKDCEQVKLLVQRKMFSFMTGCQ